MKHTHKYIRVKLSSRATKQYFKCAIAGCVHKVEKKFAVGRFSICNRCSNEFVLDNHSLDLSKPHCNDCTRSTRKDDIDKLIEVMKLS